jgi:hypothetical protein
MKEHPILFSGPMVKAILDGRKTQTRRAIKPQPELYKRGGPIFGDAQLVRWKDKIDTAPILLNIAMKSLCPYGRIGDRLWVRETWQESTSGVHYRADTDILPGTWRPSIHMPRWASRLTLEITGVKVERVQEISEEDIKAEGFDRIQYRGYTSRKIDDPEDFSDAWDAMNAKRGYSWASNPYVWVISFKRIDP